jgi:copper chaperone NosL
MKSFRVLVLIFGLLSVSSAWGGDITPIKPPPKDKCPVCGMFVAKYPDFIATIKFQDGTFVFFDGAKDMFKYYFDIKKYHPSRQHSDITAIYVTDYYTLTPIDAYIATYVIGSDVYGPMGRELIPFENRADAEAFTKDHHGKSLMKFKDVTFSLVKTRDSFYEKIQLFSSIPCR